MPRPHHILKIETLSKAQIYDIQELLTLCREAEPITLSFPTEDADWFYLLYQEESLICAAAVCLMADHTAELSAFTAPALRRQGYFQMLLEEISEDFPDEDLLLITDNHSPSAQGALEALEADHWYDEYLMAISLEHVQVPSECRITLSTDESVEPNRRTILMDGRRVGSYCLSTINQEAYFYGFEIDPVFRGQGLGYEAFLLAMAAAKEEGHSSLFLQVSGDNTAAVRLYKKAGLHIRETLSYYLY